MARRLLFGALGIFAWLAGTGDALATTYLLSCANTSGDHLQASLTGTAPWTAPATTAAVMPGDLVELTGTCQGDVVLANVNGTPITGITIANEGNTSSFSDFPSDGINGQIEIKNAQLALQGITAESGQSGDLMTNGEFANVYAHESASVTLSGDQIGPGPLIGVYVLRGSSAQLLSSTVTGVGTSNTAKENDGVRVEASSTVVLARTSGNAATVLNGGGNGITLIAASSMEFFDGTVHDNAGAQIYVSSGSSAVITGVGVETASTASPQPPLIEVMGASTATIDTNSFIQNTGGGTAAGALLVASASSVVLNSATFDTTGLSRPVIETTGGSSLVLAGGNSITASGTGGVAIEIDHSSNPLHEQAAAAGYTANATETIAGGGLVQVQSSMDLGQGDISGNPSMSWTLISPSTFAVQQNSSFRLSGGVTISGANIRLQQGSNGFFNCNNSAGQSCSNGPNNVSVVCVNSANDANAHVTGVFTGSGSPQTDTSVSPGVLVYSLNDVLAGDSAATHPGQTNACLSF